MFLLFLQSLQYLQSLQSLQVSVAIITPPYYVTAVIFALRRLQRVMHVTSTCPHMSMGSTRVPTVTWTSRVELC